MIGQLSRLKVQLGLHHKTKLKFNCFTCDAEDFK